MDIIAQTWTLGTGSMVITIPKNIVKMYDLKKGDWVKLKLDTQTIKKQKKNLTQIDKEIQAIKDSLNYSIN